MNITQYLGRIAFEHTLTADTDTLTKLHRQHVFQVPFENLDVHYKKRFTLDTAAVYDKIVNQQRGGFCYELNSLFFTLLQHVGFRGFMISASIFDDTGTPGPRFDHMAVVVVEADTDYLLDVGFGDLFVTPLEIAPGKVQHDGRNYFRIDPHNDGYRLAMSSDGNTFQPKYTFTLDAHNVSDFEPSCYDKQINPDSYFVKNIVCTRPTDAGRITLFNDRLIEQRHEQRLISEISSEDHRREVLRSEFGLAL
ncbi:arylamine N-acetyltransferase [Fulvivirgaceae bacterium PWU5]|uniref:Arylamine N-acetyltransferase n=1 Tax=Dawidia cretensis TaxID=2782350 RepID=A0AAP2GUN0_9BACT|nr:arylamine N-acetyltransferase [Dawidia cretensis]MBT1707742.1 arylamine N-acetyltransferase [Dawidia cretensis]